jgi:hypothetical protein
MSKALCGHAYLCQPYTLSQAEAAHLRAANFPLDESPYLFKVLQSARHVNYQALTN